MKTRYIAAAGLLTLAGVAIIAGIADEDSAESARALGPTGTPDAVRWIVAGGGASPESNELSIEEDLRLAQRVLPGEGLTLYASGPDSQAVRVEGEPLPTDALVARLGGIFNPRSGRNSRYQAAQIDAAGAATPAKFLDAVKAASHATGPPLTVYVAGHGDVGEKADDNAIVMWANFTVTPVELGEALSGAARQTRLVITTCFSGGFAELALLQDANACGLFASTWDREAGGCDPDPDRGRHDGYGVHFLSALDGKKRDGTALKADVLDIDGDGERSLMDAHTFARLSSKSIDVPTTTSERWLREVVPADATAEPIVLAHEDAVIGVFAKSLGVASEGEALMKLEAIDEQLTTLADAEAAASKRETEAFWDASAAILARWPVLDDPWHPLWRDTLDEHRTAIEGFIASSREVAALDSAMGSVDQLGGKRASLEVRRAPLHRLLRAYETRRLASALSATGGADWDRYVALHACENSAP